MLLAQADGASAFSPFLMLAVMFAIFYFMMIRPQQKQQKQHSAFLAGLKKGDEVATASGIVGKVAAVADRLVTLEVANNVKIRVLKAQIAGEFRESTEAPAATIEEQGVKK